MTIFKMLTEVVNLKLMDKQTMSGRCARETDRMEAFMENTFGLWNPPVLCRPGLVAPVPLVDLLSVHASHCVGRVVRARRPRFPPSPTSTVRTFYHMQPAHTSC